MLSLHDTNKIIPDRARKLCTVHTGRIVVYVHLRLSDSCKINCLRNIDKQSTCNRIKCRPKSHPSTHTHTHAGQRKKNMSVGRKHAAVHCTRVNTQLFDVACNRTEQQTQQYRIHRISATIRHDTIYIHSGLMFCATQTLQFCYRSKQSKCSRGHTHVCACCLCLRMHRRNRNSNSFGHFHFFQSNKWMPFGSIYIRMCRLQNANGNTRTHRTHHHHRTTLDTSDMYDSFSYSSSSQCSMVAPSFQIHFQRINAIAIYGQDGWITFTAIAIDIYTCYRAIVYLLRAAAAGE